MDADELGDYLNENAGEHSWFLMSVWAFAPRPETPPNITVIPAIMPEAVALKVKLADLEDGRERRVYGEHIVGNAELRAWRWVAKSVYQSQGGAGVFPWEIIFGTEASQHG